MKKYQGAIGSMNYATIANRPDCMVIQTQTGLAVLKRGSLLLDKSFDSATKQFCELLTCLSNIEY